MDRGLLGGAGGFPDVGGGGVITTSDLLAVNDSGGCTLFIRDQGHIGIEFVILLPNGHYAKTHIWKEDLGKIIETLQGLHERNMADAARS